MKMTAEETQFWDENGFLIREGVFDKDDLEILRAALEELQGKATAAEGDSDRYIFSLFGGEGAIRQVQQIAEPHEASGAFMTLSRDPRILDVVEGIIGPNILLYYSMLMMKPPSGGAAAPWHQDMSFFVHDSARLVAAQVYLDDATLENGCVRVVPGSHKRGLLNHFEGDRFTGVVQGDTTAFDEAQVSVTVPAGSIALWHGLTLHSSLPNNSGRPRRAVVFEYKDPASRILTGSFAKTEVRQAGSVVRGEDSRGELLPAF
jgi:ectoine hydroxylase-related dioxygenase (phytanoyl-CoA dioxygenase family)